jgi:adhesin HecA-like repeat protein
MRFWRQWIASLFAMCAHQIGAIELAVNGGFELNGGVSSSAFTNWTVVNHPLSSGSRFYVQTGTRPEFAKFDVPATSFGSFAAMSDQPSPGATAIYQNVSVPASGASWVQMRLFILNQVPDFSPQPSLDPTVEGNQQVRVDVMTTASDPFDVGAGVLLNVFKTPSDFPRELGYFPIAINLQPFAGQTVRIRVAEVDNRHGLIVGVDDVRVTNVPPATCAPVRPRLGMASCNFDIDGDGFLTQTDGLLILRRLLGFSGNSVVNGVSLNSCATLTTEPQINAAIDFALADANVTDIDGNGLVSGGNDGLMILRALGGRKGIAVTENAVGSGAARADWESIRTALNLGCLTALLP